MTKNKDIIFWYSIDDKFNLCSDGQRCFKKSKKSCFKVYDNPTNYDFKLINAEVFIKKNYNEEALLKAQQDYVKDGNQLFKLSNGNVNIFNYDKLNDCILDYFYKSTNIRAKKLSDFEKEMISCSGGGVRFCDEGYTGQVAKYDYASFYPSILQRNNFTVPIQEPEVRLLSDFYDCDLKDFSGIPEVGWYNLKVYCDDKKIFTVKKNNWYTNYELYHLIKYNIKFEVLSTSFYYYDRSKCVKSGHIFKKYITEFYEYKQENKNKLAKNFLNLLWGLLSKQHMRVVTHKITDNKFIKPDDKIIKMIPQGDSFIFEICKKEISFTSNFARIKPFLLSKGRCLMHTKIIKSKPSNIVYAHTDSLFAKGLISNSISKKAIGRLKCEGIYKRSNIINSNKTELFNF